MAKIFIVETDSGYRRAAANLLRESGHQVVEHADGEKALRSLAAAEPDLVIIDTLMPKMGGSRLLQGLLAGPAESCLPVIFRAPAFVEMEARALAEAQHALFVPKQAAADLLISTVDAALASRQPVSAVAAEEIEAFEEIGQELAGKLYRHAENAERVGTELARDIAKSKSQLEVARAAVDREIKKRLWAERELTRLNVGLRDQAMRDPLTGLYNRRYLEETLFREENRARRSGMTFGVMMIDIDFFKHFNDTLGHLAGDAVLCALGRYMQTFARAGDIVARYGGEEFAIVLSESSQSTVWQRAEAIRLGAQQLDVEHEGRPIGEIALSIGVGIFPDHGDSGLAVLRVADVALYQAKQAGRNRTVVGDIGSRMRESNELHPAADLPSLEEVMVADGGETRH